MRTDSKTLYYTQTLENDDAPAVHKPWWLKELGELPANSTLTLQLVWAVWEEEDKTAYDVIGVDMEHGWAAYVRVTKDVRGGLAWEMAGTDVYGDYQALLDVKWPEGPDLIMERSSEGRGVYIDTTACVEELLEELQDMMATHYSMPVQLRYA